MPTLGVNAFGFAGPYAWLNGSHSVPVSRRRAVKSAVTVGLPILSRATPTSGHAVALAAYKALATKCAIEFSSQSLRQPKEYRQMDPSEKANISYWIGMTFAALMADQLLKVPRLMHAAALGPPQLTRANPLSRRLADLVGQDPRGAWHVLEAKGRQDYPGARTINRWKAQATTIAAINGSRPATSSYSVALIGGTYSARLVDPEEDAVERRSHIELMFEYVDAVSRYYGPLVEWLSDNPRVVHREGVQLAMKLAAFDSLENEFLFLGLRQDAMKAVRDNELPQASEPHELADSYIGSDGIAVVTSASQDLS